MKRTGMKHYIMGVFMTMLFMSATLLGGCGQKKDDKTRLQEITAEQKALGADFSNAQYEWDKDGNLTGIGWNKCSLNGEISFSEFAKLTELGCWGNPNLSNLDVSDCMALRGLNCSENQLSNLDVSGCIALEELNCSENQLSSLDVSGCIALKKLDCSENQLSNLNVSDCTVLDTVTCYGNLLNKNSFTTEGCNKSMFVTGTAIEGFEGYILE